MNIVSSNLQGPWRIAVPAGTTVDNSGSVVTNPLLTAQIGSGSNFTDVWGVATALADGASNRGRYFQIDRAATSVGIMGFCTSNTATFTFTIWRCYEYPGSHTAQQVVKVGPTRIATVDNAVSDLWGSGSIAAGATSITIDTAGGGDLTDWTTNKLRLVDSSAANQAGIALGAVTGVGTDYFVSPLFKIATNGAVGIFTTVSVRATAAGLLMKCI